ncbi:MAG: FKBP-type peptidyl-prolyl cis-trans isomerase [Fimbriiglobus sp.]
MRRTTSTKLQMTSLEDRTTPTGLDSMMMADIAQPLTQPSELTERRASETTPATSQPLTYRMPDDAIPIGIPEDEQFRGIQPPPVAGDFNNDGVVDNVVVNGSKIGVNSGRDGSVIIAPFAPFEESYSGTLNFAVGNVMGDLKSELIVAPSDGGGGVAVIYDNLGQELNRFFTIADPNYRGGNTIHLRDLDRDGKLDLVAAAGVGGGPRIAVFDGDTLGANNTRLMPDFFAFESAQVGGATVNFTTNEIVFGAGLGGAPRVRGLGFSQLRAATQSGTLNTADFNGFDQFVGDVNSRNGVKLIQESQRDPNFGNLLLRVVADIGDNTLVPVASDEGYDVSLIPSTGMSETFPNISSSEFVPLGTQGLKVREIAVGSGESATDRSDVTLYYTGWLAENGFEFESNRNFSPSTFNLQNVIAGFQQGVVGMKPGGIRQIVIPAALAYGEAGNSPIPPNADLVFEVKMTSVGRV